MSSLEGITKVCLPREIAHNTQHFLRQVGARGNEGMVLWVGVPEAAVFHITDLLIPRQHGIQRSDGVCVVVDTQEMLRINMELFQAQKRLIAQVHSHPGRAYHSEMDDEQAIANTIGSLSLVVPDFAARNFSITDCAIYRLRADGEWIHLPPGRAGRLIELI